MKINDTLYDIIKYVCCIALPAVQVALLALGKIYGWEWAPVAGETLIIVQTLIAALFCVSIAGYQKEEK